MRRSRGVDRGYGPPHLDFRGYEFCNGKLMSNLPAYEAGLYLRIFSGSAHVFPYSKVK